MTKSRKKKQHNPKVPQQYIRDFKPKTKGQEEYIRAIAENTLTICDGLAGTGKTACAVALACEYLVYNKVKKIIITRPVVETGYSLGYLPGTAQEKLHEYMIPVLHEIEDFFGPSKAEELIHFHNIDIVPLNYMRGRNMHETFLIVDEAQNCTYDQLKMAISRIGKNSKCVINGDSTQCDLRTNDFTNFYKKLDGADGLSLVKLYEQDMVRNPMIAHWLRRLS